MEPLTPYIMHLCKKLDTDLFMSTEKRNQIMQEINRLVIKRENYRRVMGKVESISNNNNSNGGAQK